MKIIDTHTHLPGYSFGSTPVTVEKLRRDFTGEGLASAWIFTVDGLIDKAEENNDILAHTLRYDRDFFIPFCSVNPHRGAEKAIAELVRSKEDLGMRGLKLHPWLQSFSLTHPAVIPILKKAGELDMPVLFHDGTPPYTNPLQIAWAAEQVPETTIILGHAGLDDLYNDAILACRRQKNIYLCLCSLSSGRIGEIIRKCPPDKLLYGSDGGFAEGLISDAIEKIRSACMCDNILQAIFQDNPHNILP
ncbi:amidohydrolase family protein [Candidatus Latescibacterota bacterium]